MWSEPRIIFGAVAGVCSVCSTLCRTSKGSGLWQRLQLLLLLGWSSITDGRQPTDLSEDEDAEADVDFGRDTD